MIANKIPILEYDSTSPEVIAPNRDAADLKLPEKCLFAFLGDVVHQYAKERQAKVVKELITVSHKIKVYVLHEEDGEGVESVKTIPANATGCVLNPIKDVVTRIPHDVSGHPRNLPEGCHASLSKLQEAKEAGIQLLDGQTYVNPYSTGKSKVA